MEQIRAIANYVVNNQGINEDIGDAFECGWNAHLQHSTVKVEVDAERVSIMQSENYGHGPLTETPSGIQLITQEREEQISKHGRTVQRDVEENSNEELRRGAIALIVVKSEILQGKPGKWSLPIWQKMWSKPYKQRLITAGALIAAEIDRVNYLENQEGEYRYAKNLKPIK